MNIVMDLTGRNLRLYFRDRLNVFFSLIAVLVLFLLYTLFLGNQQVESLSESFPQATRAEVKGLVDSWMFAGIVGITTITTGLAAANVVVDDTATDRFRDFLVSPISRGQLVLGYLLSIIAISLIMTTLVMVASLVYLGLVDGVALTGGQLARTYGYVVLSCAAFGALSAFAVTYVRTPGAFAAMSTVVGTVLGFAAGSYVPVGAFPEGVRNFVSALPFMQSSMVIRQEMTAGPMDTVTDVPEAAAVVQDIFGITARVGDWVVPTGYVVFVLAAMVVVLTALAALRIRSRIR
ncbi:MULTISPECIES: ABC transporter permease [unclassified Arthrobacter]|uniref:ABC transporter permease n=1 Tax=unclassified Arthrobacter TaxID=235627 RepID=UPI001E3C72A3|nr:MULTISPECIES: ABC transporter permease [unclassified Arthrobacter]MCC9144549.1 ABC transporter permease [Arthrobacter sp. zg-Y919]MDK1275775.1 ABC transporter permease [Arthrobacter sp. zg.Y919]MDM7991406.1 ABC transporter permease [Arthrobacter sp. zg-Y877]WIB02860.1 ABC transporter permease [Arthrobacter sp. zg-Y919]